MTSTTPAVTSDEGSGLRQLDVPLIGESYAATARESLEVIAARLYQELLAARRSGRLPEGLGFDVKAVTAQREGATGSGVDMLEVNLYSEPVGTPDEYATLDAAMFQVVVCASEFNAIDVTHPERARFQVAVTAYDHPGAPARDEPLRVLVAGMYGDHADYVRELAGPVEPLPAPPTSPGAVQVG